MTCFWLKWRSIEIGRADCKGKTMPRHTSILLLLLVGCSSSIDAKDSFHRYEQAGFLVDMIDLPVVVDEGMPGFGKYKLSTADKSTSTEVSWEVGNQLSRETVEHLVANIFKGTVIDSKLIDSRAGEGWVEAAASGSINGKVHMRLIIRHCQASGLQLTLGFTSVDEKRSRAMYERGRRSLRCKPADRKDFRGREPPSAALPETFGYLSINLGKFEGLVNKEGYAVAYEGAAKDNLEGALRRPELLTNVWANTLGIALNEPGPVTVHAGLGGATQSRLTAKSARSGSAYRFAVMFCPDDGQQYVLVAFNALKKSDPARLDPLLDQMGCPSTQPGSLINRPTSCDIGHTATCKDAEAQ